MPYTTLISTAILAERLDDPGWITIDCRHDLADPERGRRQYGEAHLPGALFLHADEDLAGPRTGANGRHPLPDPAVLATRLGQCGVDASKQVIAYDAQGGVMASRLWWLLRWLGHDAVALLDGGLKRWLAEGRGLTSVVRTPRRVTFIPALHPIAVAVDTVHELVRTGRRDHVIVDARTSDRYRGENETLDPVAGHIPGALNRPCAENLAADGGFKSAAELAADWRRVLGDRKPEGVIHSCGSGVSACHNMLALAIAEMPPGRLFAGSWSEWVADPDRPIATGPVA